MSIMNELTTIKMNTELIERAYNIACRVNNNIGSLEFVILFNDIYHKLKEKERPKSNNEKINLICKTVCDYLNVSMNDIKSKSRIAVYVDARNISMYLIDKYLNKINSKTVISQIAISKIFNRDHATFIHAKKNIANLCFSDKEYLYRLERIEKFINHKLCQTIPA